MKKIAVIALVLIICLSAVGVGYAKWTDPVDIHGSVRTGTVDLKHYDGYSGTWVYKDMCTHDMVFSDHPIDGALTTEAEAVTTGGSIDCPPPCPKLLVASAVASQWDASDEAVLMTWTNLLPTCQPLTADAIWQYTGTIPAVLKLGDCTFSNPALAPYVTKTLFFRKCTADGWSPVDPGKTEIYTGWFVKLVVGIKIPELNELQGLSATFTCTLTAEQWDDCPNVG